MQITQLKEAVAAAGCVGAGGAGFPTAVKIAGGADALLINASECEPLLYTDYTLLREQMDAVLSGARRVMEAAGIAAGYLAVKEHTASRLGLTHGQRLSYGITAHVLPNVYPIGDEIILTYQVLHRVIAPGKLPISAGALVLNVETLYNVENACRGVSVTQKWLTVGGKVPQPVALTVPVGMRVCELLMQLGITVPEDCVVIDGGPAMGAVINPEQAVVKKTTKGLLVLPRDIPAVYSKLAENRAINAHASANCCQCTMCTDLCPRALLGYPLAPHRIVRAPLSFVEEAPELFLEASLCSGCGVCELTACCQGISPRRVYAQVKGILAKNRLRYAADGGVSVSPEREYRMLPAERFMQRIGVAAFDVLPRRAALQSPPRTLCLPLRQHAGAPAVPCVHPGDAVEPGQLIAAAAEGISAALHSSVSGVIQDVSDGQITILAR